MAIQMFSIYARGVISVFVSQGKDYTLLRLKDLPQVRKMVVAGAYSDSSPKIIFSPGRRDSDMAPPHLSVHPTTLMRRQDDESPRSTAEESAV